MAVTTVIDPSNKVPMIAIDVQLGVGPRTSGASTRHVELTGNKTSAGSMSVEQEYDVFSSEEAAALAGPGSELHIMYLFAALANPSASIKMTAITESAGAAATGAIVFAGTATASGTVVISAMGTDVLVPYAVGDASTVIATRAASYINNQASWPMTAAAASSTTTATAKNKGPRGNLIALRARVSEGAGITVTQPATGYLTGGTTSDSPQNVLDVLSSVRRYYIVSPYVDSTNLTMYRTHVDAQDNPEVGNRKQFIFGSLDTIGATTTIATGQNATRGQCVWMRGSDVPPGCLAAAMASFRAGKEAIHAAHNFDADIVSGLPPVYASSLYPSGSELKAALDNGITPLVRTNDGQVSIVRSVTTKSQDSGGRPDSRVLDTSKVTVPDAVADDIEVKFSDFAGWMADNNPPDGEAPQPETLTPDLCKQSIIEVCLEREASRDIARGTTLATADQIVCDLSKVSAGRFNCTFPVDVIEGFHQASIAERQIG